MTRLRTTLRPLEDFRPRSEPTRHVQFRALAESFVAHQCARGSRSAADFASVMQRVWVPYFGEHQVRKLTVEDVVAAVEALEATGYAGKTVRKYVSHLSTCLEYAIRRGWLSRNVCRQLPRRSLPPNRPADASRAPAEVLTPQQVGQLLGCERIPFGDRLLYGLLLNTGLRPGEAYGLRWSDLGPGDPLRQLRVARSYDSKDQRERPTKSGHVRRVPVRPELERLLARSVDWWPSVFGRRPGLTDLVAPAHFAAEPRHWNSSTALRRWHLALADASIAHPPTGPRRLHSTRHTFVSLCLRAGASEHAVMALTHQHHNRREAFFAYAHHDWAALCAAATSWSYPGAL